jgi:hypothetical protein
MGAITTGSFAKDLYPGVKTWYGAAYDEHKPVYTQIFKQETSTRKYEEEVGFVGTGLAVVKDEEGGISYDTMSQGYIKRYTHVTYGLGFKITREAYEDAIWDKEAKQKARALAFSMRQTPEHVHANILNRAFNSSYTGADAKELCATDHPNISGGTWANELTTAADISELALEQACIDVYAITNDRGLLIALLSQTLIIPPALDFEATRIIKSQLQNDTANNAINAIRASGKFPGGVVVNPYLTDSDAWFIQTNAPDGLKTFTRRAQAFATENDFETEVAKFKATHRYSCGWTDPRGVFGSPGA